MSSSKNFGLLDQILIEFDQGLRNLSQAGPPSGSASPATHSVEEEPMSDKDKALSARLMRVNHAGEVAAQALYHAQSLTARSEDIRDRMAESAKEERDHLAWCAKRLEELGSQRSLLDPVWYAGSFAIGAIAGAAGDRWSLGFVAETERQVVRHLDEHLQKLPAGDQKSRAILEQMREDEEKHGTNAVEAGAAELPAPVKDVMGVVSKIMTRTALWV